MATFIENMREMSAQVLHDSALENGAMIAANGMYLPPTATPYHFVWGRDAAKHLLAADALGMADAPDIRKRFLEWIVRCVPGDEHSRLLIKRNHLNGPNDFLYNDDRGFQPDNNGSLLSAIDATRTDTNDPLADSVMRLLANGLAAKWDTQQQRFSMRQQDLWENNVIDPTENNFFSHALLSAAHGLGRATAALQTTADTTERDRWQLASNQMYDRFYSAVGASTTGWISKRLYATSDRPAELDAGIILAVPELVPDDAPAHVRPIVERTVRTVGEKLLALPYGAHRYEGDIYDGIERMDGSQATAGAWPLLGYAWVRAARRIGMHDEAESALNAIDSQLQKMYASDVIPAFRVPEQLHPQTDDRNGKGPMHFAWGSAEWVLAHLETRALDNRI
jgi:GH15 family glucan-1,4-alpha-glucosidase